MAGSSDYYVRALEEVARRHEAAKQRAEAAKQKLYAEIPELRALESQISAVYSDAVRRKLSGKAVDFDKAEKESLQLQAYRAELLKSAGIAAEDLEPKFTCRLCSDTGFAGGKMCECVRFIAAKMIYDEINRDVPLEKSTFATFDLKYYSDTPDSSGVSPRAVMSKIKAACERYALKFSQNSDSILFYGRTGLGKTHLSLAIANDVIAKGYNVVYAPISRVLERIEREHFSSDNNSAEALHSAIDCDLLIIDDLGTEFTTQFVTATIYDIINSRTLSGRPTIINTNLSIEELESRYSERIVSRISNKYKKFMFVGEDIRSMI